LWKLIPYVILLLQFLAWFSFVKFLRSTRFYKPSYKWLALIPFVFFDGIYLAINFIWGRSFDPPGWFRFAGVYPFYVWISSTFFISVCLLIGKIIKLPFQLPVLIAKLFRPLREKINSFKNRKAVKQADLGRRKFVRYVYSGISAYAVGAATYGLLNKDDYEVSYRKIRIENLPSELSGLTITLVCDIHASQYMNEDDIKIYSDVISSLGSDIIIMPGDFINNELSYVHPMAKALRDIKAKYGIYGSLGNHDFFQDPDYVTKAINNESPIFILRNDYKKLNINGNNLYIIGIDDVRGAGADMEAVLKYYDDVESRLNTGEEDFSKSTKILLCHKPYAFDSLAAKEIDVILSGHTHGGQVVPVKFGSFNLSFAAAVSKYIEGHYKIGKSNMYVSRGIGTVGLPIRVNCPPEVTQITLV
jgi:uncharacterized protein